jgi:thioredoxin-like negative regulator of GroEL
VGFEHYLMRVYLICLVLLVAPTLGLLGFREYRAYQATQADMQSGRQTMGRSDWRRGEVLFFNASWCGPCKQMRPIVAQMRGQGYRMRDLDVDQNRSLAKKYGIRAIPTFVFVENGAEVNRFSGGTSAEELRKMCSSPAYR